MKAIAGQISLFDIIEPPKKEIHINDIGIMVCDSFKQTITAKPARSICEFSKHECNSLVLWEIADTLDDKDKCPHICCRKCDVKYCGARCNGSAEPLQTSSESGM